MRFAFLLLFSLFFCATLLAQPGSKYKPSVEDVEEVKDKLLMLEGKSGRTNDSLRLELLNQMAVLYMKTSKDTALMYAQKALADAKAIDLKNLIAVSLYNTACIYEYYKEKATAEENFLAWMEVRMNQNDDEYRWALREMRRFYITYKEAEKLEKIEEEWMIVLDRQLDQGHISPWFDWEGGTAQENYEYSMKPVFTVLVNGGYYLLAEKSFIHMLEKCPDCCDWDYDDSPYYKAEERMLRLRDTATLTLWYDHWYNTMKKYADKEYTLGTLRGISVGYTTGYLKYDRYFDKYFPLMMAYTKDIGGDESVHFMLKLSIRYYGISYLIRIKLNLLLIQSSIKVKDNATMEKMYKDTDKFIAEYIRKGLSRDQLGKALVEARDQCKNKRFQKWCNKHLDQL